MHVCKISLDLKSWKCLIAASVFFFLVSFWSDSQVYPPAYRMRMVFSMCSKCMRVLTTKKKIFKVRDVGSDMLHDVVSKAQNML